VATATAYRSLRTSTTEALFAETDEQVETEIAVRRLVEVFQPPRVRTVVFHVLHRDISVCKRPPARSSCNRSN